MSRVKIYNIKCSLSPDVSGFIQRASGWTSVIPAAISKRLLCCSSPRENSCSTNAIEMNNNGQSTKVTKSGRIPNSLLQHPRNKFSIISSTMKNNGSSKLVDPVQFQSLRRIHTSPFKFHSKVDSNATSLSSTSDSTSSNPTNKSLTETLQKVISRTVVTSPKVAENTRSIMERQSVLSKEDREEFSSLFPELVKTLTESLEYRDMTETNRWFARVLHYNVPHGKRNRGLATALAYRYLASELTEENVKLSYVLGWCVEMLQAYFLVADDIMDDSSTRRGRPCWYKVDNLGTAAMNDSLYLESAIYEILRQYFGSKPYYGELMEIMHDVTFKTIYGQSLDTRTGLERKMESYTMDRYSAIVKYKTSFYSFYLPVRLAMAMAGIKEPEIVKQVRTVTLEIGHYFQVQDDYLDCFGNVDITGKIGTDIQDCKCSWMFVVAMEKCNEQERQVLLENYGRNEDYYVDIVKELYTNLKLPEIYQNYEEQTYNLITSHIKQMSSRLPKQLFMDMINMIYRRSG